MHEPPDPFDTLRDLNPVKPDDLEDARSQQAEAALARILDENPQRRGRLRRPRERRRVLIRISAVAAVALVAAAVALLATNGTTRQTVNCYADTALKSTSVKVETSQHKAVATCRSAWRRGSFGSRSAPPLRACVLPSGTVGVFPNESGQACQQLNLQSAPGVEQQPPADTRVEQLRTRLERAARIQQCLTTPSAVSLIRSQFRQLRLSDWTVAVAPTLRGTTKCSRLTVDAERRTVTVQPAR